MRADKMTLSCSTGILVRVRKSQTPHFVALEVARKSTSYRIKIGTVDCKRRTRYHPLPFVREAEIGAGHRAWLAHARVGARYVLEVIALPDPLSYSKLISSPLCGFVASSRPLPPAKIFPAAPPTLVHRPRLFQPPS